MTFRRDESNKPVPVPKGFSLLTTLAGHTGRLSTVTVAPDGRSAVSGSQDGTIAIWDLVSGRITRTLTGHTDYVTSVAVAPDGRSFITGSVDNTVKVWDFGAGQLLRSVEDAT
jgi:WD40 repeat protein